MRGMMIFLMALALSAQANGAEISGPMQCVLKGAYTVKYNGKSRKSLVTQKIDYLFNADGTYSSFNYAAPDIIGQGTWFQAGQRFTINADLDGMKESVLQQCGNTPEGLSYGCSVTKMNVVVSGVSNQNATKMNGTFVVDQEITYNNTPIVIGGFAKLRLSCVPM